MNREDRVVQTIAAKERPDWDSYFMAKAYITATRSTCDRKHVGCILVNQDHHDISSGYNGSPPGKPHCDEAGHEMVDGHCVRTVHAEANAIAQAARQGNSVDGACCYSTVIPCYDCAKLLLTAGISEVIFHGFYQSRYDMSDRVSKYFLDAGVTVMRLTSFQMVNVTSMVEEEEVLLPKGPIYEPS